MIPADRPKWTTRVCLAAILLLFITTASLFIRRPGIEVDESVIGVGMYAPYRLWYAIKIFGANIPIMVMSYYGALKTWLYMPIFAVFAPNPISLRLPTVLAGAAAVLLFFRLLDRTVGRKAAWIGALLLATDTSFVILEAIDYGPNALHFLWVLGGLLLLVRFHQGASRWNLAGAFFLFGLGLWDKATFPWVLFGITVASVCVFPREFGRHLTIRNLSAAAAAFLVGALPFVIFNIQRPMETFKMNVKKASDDSLDQKEAILVRTIEGSAFFGFFTAAGDTANPGQPFKPSQVIADVTQHPVHNWTLYALAYACLSLLLPGARRPILFGLIAAAGTWLPMAFTAAAGGAAHHVIFLWPFPFLAIAAAFARGKARWLPVLLTSIICASNLALTNQYYVAMARNGLAVRWSDAFYPLTQRLVDLKTPHVYAIDWNIFESVNLLTQGKVNVSLPDFHSPDSTLQMICEPGAVFVTHTPRFAFFPQQRTMIEEAAATAGYEEERIDIVYDRNGRPTFDVFRFRKIPL